MPEFTGSLESRDGRAVVPSIRGVYRRVPTVRPARIDGWFELDGLGQVVVHGQEVVVSIDGLGRVPALIDLVVPDVLAEDRCGFRSDGSLAHLPSGGGA